MLADDRRLHDALAVDHAPQAAGPGRVDQGVGDAAAIEWPDVALADRPVKRHDDRDRRIELAEAAQHPVLASCLVVPLNVHGREELLGDFDLPLPMYARVFAMAAELARMRNAGEIALGIAGADAVERFAGDDIEIPRLGVERGRRAHGEF